MNSLFIDTSCKYLCIGIAKNNKVIYKLQQEAIKKQSELTIPFLQEALSKNDMNLNDIDEVVVTIGPGSFTGIRIGVATTKAFHDSLDIPCIGISSLEALGYNLIDINENECVFSMIDCKNDNCYFALFQ